MINIRGPALPTEEVVDLCADGEVWRTGPSVADSVVIEGWLVPGLADVHTHPGAPGPGEPLDTRLLREDLAEHARAGVTLLRCPGLAGEPPEWFGTDPELPRAVHAGPWLARPGQFFDGWGLRPSDTDLPLVAAAQAARTGWCKLIGDWGPDDEPISLELLETVVREVHAVGGRVAVHTQHGQGAANAVNAGVDSLEHGMGMDPALLDQMARQGTVLVPTLGVLTKALGQVRERPPSARRDWFLAGMTAHPHLVAAAAEAGVTLLAGTDDRPHGQVAHEIQVLAAAGVAPEIALGAGSWIARSFLGLAGLVEGAPADAVVYDSDPRSDLTVLEHPVCVIIRGRIVHRPVSVV